MNLLTKTIVLNSTTDILKFREFKAQKIKIILLNEKILIKIIKVKNYNCIEEKIEELIKDMFSNYIPLVHYEKLRIKRNNFLIVYFIGCDERFKCLLGERKKFTLVPYIFNNKKIYILRNTIFELKNKEIRIYLKGRLILVREIDTRNIIYCIKESINSVEEILEVSLSAFKVNIQEKYLNDEIKEYFKGIKVNTIRGDENLYKKI